MYAIKTYLCLRSKNIPKFLAIHILVGTDPRKFFMKACKADKLWIIKYLLHLYGTVLLPLRIDYHIVSLETLEFLADHPGIEIDFKKKELLFLRRAASEGDIKFLEFLENRGIKLENSGDFIMEQAAENNQLEFIKYLVNRGFTVSDLAAYYAAKSGHLEMTKYLVSLGAKINLKDGMCMQLAARNGNLEMLKFL